MKQLFNGIKNILFYWHLPKVDKYTSNKRMDICKKCNWHRQNFNLWFSFLTIKGSEQCIQCKCKLSLKTKIKYESCPIDKW